ncbi:NAD(P)H-dependent oxidoreductase [Roseateles saccharophilus]|uniref:Putative NADPH-quinone reductase n=1 Tax=Roseateles saccharophilus TaxID=304 RepID=A0A4V2VS69_ROSSA|nr:NAD(P)H-dependent oxidoreductase [Roseateles saccharophilus]MDG0831732.1 flavodoxin family protein [Roseateles saccharophilus]TCV01250.1 putative NADPH-quinone reductase [Roseateles saccharophilus]
MPDRIALIQAHPDPAGGHLCHALAQAYADGARKAGREVQWIDVARLDFPLLRTQQDWAEGSVPATLRPAQDVIRWADHLVIFFPLWLGDMPALLKAFLEQIARRGFAFEPEPGNPLGRKLLTGRSARVVVTMGMPAMVYRWYFRAHSVKALERNILGFVGIGPINELLIGGVEGLGDSGVRRWLGRLRELGMQGQ